MNKYLDSCWFRSKIGYLQKTVQKQSVKQHGRAANDVLFFLNRVALLCLQHSKLTVRISRVILHVFMINTVEKILRKDLQKKLRPALSKWKEIQNVATWGFVQSFFVCLRWEEVPKSHPHFTHLWAAKQLPAPIYGLGICQLRILLLVKKSLENGRNIHHTTLAS